MERLDSPQYLQNDFCDTDLSPASFLTGERTQTKITCYYVVKSSWMSL